MKFEVLTEHIDKLHALVHDPQPGILAWHGFLHERMSALIADWDASPADPRPENERPGPMRLQKKRPYYLDDQSGRWWVLLAANRQRAREFSTNEGGRGEVRFVRPATPEEVVQYTQQMGCEPEEV